jgi:hypothetical protein
MGSVGGHHDFKGGCELESGLFLGQVCVGKIVAYEKEGEKKLPLKSIVDDPLNESFDSNTRVERISLISNLR